MKRLIAFAFFIIILGQPAIAKPYGTIILPNGKKIVLFKSKRHAMRSYIVELTKDNKIEASCRQEAQSVYQARKAYMMAKASFQRGFAPDIARRNCDEQF